jgi:hypothetical protein
MCKRVNEPAMDTEVGTEQLLRNRNSQCCDKQEDYLTLSTCRLDAKASSVRA